MMGLKKIVIDIIVISLAFLLFVIWYQNCIADSVQMTAIPKQDNINVYLITTDRGFEFWDKLNKGASDMAALMGINYTWESPDVRSIEGQIELINNAVEQGADALLISADDPVMIADAVENAVERGVKVIYVDSPANREAIITLATDNYKAGVVAGQTLITILEDMRKLSGSIGIISLADKANAQQRDKGFRQVLEEDGRYRILETVYVDGINPEEAQNAAELMMRENDDLVALFGTGERTSIGVGNAIKASGNQYVGIGFDRTTAMMKLLQDRNLNAIIDQNPYTMGYLGMAEAVAAVKGRKTGPKYIDTGVTVYTRY